MKSKPIDMVIDTAITVLFVSAFIICWMCLFTLTPETVNVIEFVSLILAQACCAIGSLAGILAVTDYFKE